MEYSGKPLSSPTVGTHFPTGVASVLLRPAPIGVLVMCDRVLGGVRGRARARCYAALQRESRLRDTSCTHIASLTCLLRSCERLQATVRLAAERRAQVVARRLVSMGCARRVPRPISSQGPAFGVSQACANPLPVPHPPARAHSPPYELGQPIAVPLPSFLGLPDRVGHAERHLAVH